MPLTDYTFRLGDTGTELNIDDLDLPFVDLTRIYGFDSAPIRETERDHEGVDGGFMDAEFEKGRPIMLEGEAFADVAGLGMENYLDGLKREWAPSRVPVPLYFKAPGVDERVMFIKPRGLRYDWAPERRLGISRVQFVGYAEDPRIYTASLQSTVIAFGGEVTTGFAFNVGFNVSFGGGGAPAGQNVENFGNRPAPALLIIDGPVVSPLIANETVGKTIQAVLNVQSGQQLVIDTGNRTVILNGTLNRRNTLTQTGWFDIEPGVNFIRFGGSSGSGTLTIQFRSAWR